MARTSSAGREKSERILVLAVDIDNDLYRKTKITGPLLGRVQNLNGATQLSLADPEDTDSNTMFEAVKLYDELKEEGYSVNVATITGAENGGYAADREIVRQLEQTLNQFKSDVCIFVTTGASDSRALPLIESRIKINSVKSVTVKQSKALESTYIAILEKLKEPHYARIIFGIPAILLLLFSVSYLLGLGWQLPVAIVGSYLLIKGFGFEDAFISSFRGFSFSVDRMSFVFYLSSVIFFLASLFIGSGNYSYELGHGATGSTALLYSAEGFMLLLPFVLLLYLIGRITDVRSSKYVFRNFKYGIYIGSSIILWVMLYTFTAWIIGQIYFGQLILFTIGAIAAGMIISEFAMVLRKSALRKRNLNNKAVINELGTLIGKVAKTDVKGGGIIVNTSFGNPIRYSVDRIVEISDRVVIR